MRTDKFLKCSRLIKRRTAAKEACEQGRVFLNDRAAKPGAEVKGGDRIRIAFGSGSLNVKVLDTAEPHRKEDAAAMYEIIDGQV